MFTSVFNCSMRHWTDSVFARTLSFYCKKCDQAINNLAVTDDNKVKIVEAGALPHYVKLLHTRDYESEQTEAAKRAKELSSEEKVEEQRLAANGLWMLAFKCKDDIIKESGCLEG